MHYKETKAHPVTVVSLQEHMVVITCDGCTSSPPADVCFTILPDSKLCCQCPGQSQFDTDMMEKEVRWFFIVLVSVEAAYVRLVLVEADLFHGFRYII